MHLKQNERVKCFTNVTILLVIYLYSQLYHRIPLNYSVNTNLLNRLIGSVIEMIRASIIVVLLCAKTHKHFIFFTFTTFFKYGKGWIFMEPSWRLFDSKVDKRKCYCFTVFGVRCSSEAFSNSNLKSKYIYVLLIINFVFLFVSINKLSYPYGLDRSALYLLRRLALKYIFEK